MQLNKNQIILMFGEFTDRLNFYGIQSILILYLMHQFLFSQDRSLTIYGIYSSFCFIYPLIGGYCADRFLNRYYFVLLGIIFILLGNLVFVFGSSNMLFLAIDLIIIGIGFFKPNNINLFDSTCYDSKQKYASFTLYYAIMTLGAIVGPFIYSTLNISINWRLSFIISFFLSLISLGLYLLRLNSIFKFRELGTASKIHFYKIILIIIAMLMGIYLCFIYDRFFGLIIWSSGVIVSIFLAYHSRLLPLEQKRQQFLLLILMIFGLLFYSVTFQVSSTLILYANAYVKTKIFGFTIPPGYFMSIYSIFIAISAFMSTKIPSANQKLTSSILTKKISLSLYLGSISFFVLAISTTIRESESILQLLLILFALFILGLGELAVGPVINLAVSQLVPESKRGIFMGLWCLLIGYAAYLSSVMAKMIDLPNYVKIFCVYFQSFIIIAIFTLFLAFSMSLMKQYLNRLFVN